MDKFGILIVTYKPDIRLLAKNIEVYAKIASHVVVVNNGQSLNVNDTEIRNLELINLGENKGIAFAQNIGVNVLSKLGVEYVFMSDQDSSFSDDYFDLMLKEWHSIKKNDKTIGALAPIVYDRNNKSFLPVYTCFDSVNKIEINDKFDNRLIDRTMPISSGLLTRVDIYIMIGGNDEELFIDWVDIDFDWRLLERGYNIYTTKNIKMSHTLGKIKRIKFLFRTFTTMNHSPIRDYYYFRNGIYLLHKYEKTKLNVGSHIRKALLYKFKDALLEENKKYRLKKIFKAILDGNKMAKKKHY